MCTFSLLKKLRKLGCILYTGAHYAGINTVMVSWLFSSLCFTLSLSLKASYTEDEPAFDDIFVFREILLSTVGILYRTFCFTCLFGFFFFMFHLLLLGFGYC